VLAVAKPARGPWASGRSRSPDGEFYEIEIAGTDGEYYFDATGRRADNRYEDA
jgi:hypothetical protein